MVSEFTVLVLTAVFVSLKLSEKKKRNRGYENLNGSNSNEDSATLISTNGVNGYGANGHTHSNGDAEHQNGIVR